MDTMDFSCYSRLVAIEFIPWPVYVKDTMPELGFSSEEIVDNNI